MAQFSMMWTTGATGDGTSPYTQAQVTTWLRRSFVNDPATEGVVPDYPKTGSKELTPAGTASPVTIAPGAAWVYGFPYESTASENITVPTPVGGTTGHRIVLRANWTTQEVRLALLSSANGNAAIPALTQDAGTTWEIPIASLTITTGGVITLTDQRAFVHLNTRVSAAMMDASAATDTAIGNRTVSDGGSPSGNTGTLTTLLGWIATQIRRITGKANWWTAPVTSIEALNSAKADRAGDTFTGAVTLQGTAPLLRLLEDDAAAGAKYWDLQTLNGVLTLRSRDDSGNTPTDIVRLVRSGQNLSLINFVTSALQRSGNTVWDSANDGDGSGLDADLVAGVDIAPLRRRGGNASSWGTAGTTNYSPAAYRPQVGRTSLTVGPSDTFVEQTVTFPTAFSDVPIVLLTGDIGGTWYYLGTVTASNFVVRLSLPSAPGAPFIANVSWIALGPT